MTRRNFREFDENDAPVEARAALARARARFGAIPRPLARYARAPRVLEQAETALAAFDAASLAPLEREVVALTVARRNGCDFCLRLHRGLVQRLDAPPGFFDAMVSDEPLADERLEALRRFTAALLDRAGDVDDAAWRAFVGQGFDHVQALEVVLGVATYTLTTFANRLTESA